MEVVEINAPQLLAGSDTDKGGDYTPGDPIDAPGLDDTNMFGF